MESHQSSSSSIYYSAFEKNSLREVARIPREFHYEELKTATGNFKDKLGSGGSGSVFKGVLKDRVEVAVKRVDRSDYGERVFQGEISAIACVQHVHIVRIRGYCRHLTETVKVFFIVYDLLPNGSLDSWIFRRAKCPTHRYLSWNLRYKVAVEVAKGLAYLHHDCRPQILHLDIKPENILLDEEFRAVLSDFSLSRLMNEDGSRIITDYRGTAGYIAPEWLSGQGISVKSDIFSFGKVLLDLFFGQRYVCLDADGKDICNNGRNSLTENRAFLTFMWEKLTQKKLSDLIDKRILEDWSVQEKEANSLVYAALVCLDEDPKKRPADMTYIVNLLKEKKLLGGIGVMEQHFVTQTEYSHAGSIRLPPKFYYKDLRKATNNFSDKLGSGGSSIVFKGKLDDGTLVAVKSLKRSIRGEQELEEIISAISSVGHYHIVSLRGYCNHIVESERTLFLVYDLFSIGTLDNWIFTRSDGRVGGCLSWNLRYKIAIDVAQALAYLHHDCLWRFHPDIKPEIILLDKCFQAVLSSFGLLRFLKEGENRVDRTFRGKKGYTAPEFLVHETLEKADIFSFGKVLLDLFFGESDVCLGREGNNDNIGYSPRDQQKFHAFMWKSLRKNKLLNLVDRRLTEDGGVDKEEADCLVYVALWCLRENPQRRPGDMRHVVDILKARKLKRSTYFRFSSEFILLFSIENYNNQSRVASLPRKFRQTELEVATNNFRHKLGSGVYGTVFKGNLNDGMSVAVKRISQVQCRGALSEDVVFAVARVQHAGLLPLYGYCNPLTKTADYFVVHKFFPKGSLANWIFLLGDGKDSQRLPLNLRYNVAVDVAKALTHLHHNCLTKMFHFNIKPENILILDDFRAVLSDFGLSNLMPARATKYNVPEWRLNQVTSELEACDIFSFGNLLLDLVFGRRYVCLDLFGNDISSKDGRSQLQHQIFHAVMWERLSKQRVLLLVDERLREMEVDNKEASSLIYVALWCLQEDPKKRPTMQRVVEMLEERISIEQHLRPEDMISRHLE